MPKIPDDDIANNQSSDVIRILDPNLKFGFAQVPRPILKAPGLSDRAKIVYALLLDYAWQKGSCFPGQKRLAEDLHTTERTIQRALAELKEYKLVSWQRRGLTQTNIYFILNLSDNPNLDVFQRDLPPDTTKMSYQDKTLLSSQDMTPMSHKEYPLEDTKRELYISNIRMVNQDEKDDDTKENPTDGKPNKPAGLKPISAILPKREPSSKPKSYDPDKQVILEYIQDFSREFGDQAPLKSSTTRAFNLFKQSGLGLEDFIARLYEARAVTKESSASIRSSTKDPQKAFATKNKMAYFFACLEERLGLRESKRGPMRK